MRICSAVVALLYAGIQTDIGKLTGIFLQLLAKNAPTMCCLVVALLIINHLLLLMDQCMHVETRCVCVTQKALAINPR
jgi:Na+-transporting NADH:ubiquinone oxidoreductase subunit NqrD